MKIGRFLFGVAAGIAVGYMIYKKEKKEFLKPETVIHRLKNRYKKKMTITGSWIQVEPIREEFNGVQYNIYQAGLNGVVDGLPTFLEFRVDADTGSLLSVKEENKENAT